MPSTSAAGKRLLTAAEVPAHAAAARRGSAVPANGPRHRAPEGGEARVATPEEAGRPGRHATAEPDLLDRLGGAPEAG